MRSYAVLLAICLAVPAYAQIDLQSTYEPHEPIVATLTEEIPDGAKINGGWVISEGLFIQVDANTVHIWAAPGKHSATFSGMWIKTREAKIDGEKVLVLEGFGFINRSADFKVEGSKPSPPDPPEPGGPWQIMFFYDADRLDNYPEPQRQLLTSLAVREKLQSAGHTLLEVLESSAIASGSAKYKTWIDAVRGDALPRIALAPREGGAVLDFPLPGDFTALEKLLADPSLTAYYAMRRKARQ